MDETDAELSDAIMMGEHHEHVLIMKNAFHAFSYSKELRDNVGAIWSSEPDAAIRMIMLLFATSPVCEQQLLLWGRRNIRPMLNVYVMRPAIAFRMLSVIMMHAGINTGAVYSKNLRLTSEMNSIKGLIQVKLRVELANQIKKPQNIIRQHNTMVYKPRGGMNAKFLGLTAEKTKVSELERAMMGEYVPGMGSLITFVEPIAHRNTSKPYVFVPVKEGKIWGLGANIRDTSDVMAPTAWLHHGLFDFCDLRVDQGPSNRTDEVQSHINRLALPGATWYANEQGHLKVIEWGASHTSHCHPPADDGSKPGYRSFIVSIGGLQ